VGGRLTKCPSASLIVCGIGVIPELLHGVLGGELRIDALLQLGYCSFCPPVVYCTCCCSVVSTILEAITQLSHTARKACSNPWSSTASCGTP
jgi:hypothetical protein